MTGAYFPPSAIRANVEAVRKMFKERPGDDPGLACKSRMGTEIGPAYVRAVLGEVNRGVEPDVMHPALHSIIGWMIANSLAPVTDRDQRMEYLRVAIQNITMEAGAFLLENNVVDPGKDARGEIVGGHA